MNITKAEAEHDICARNAGQPCLTIWADGSYVHHGILDAEIATRCEPDAVLLTIRLDTLEPVVFPDMQRRIRLYEKIFATPNDGGRDDAGNEQPRTAEPK